MTYKLQIELTHKRPDFRAIHKREDGESDKAYNERIDAITKAGAADSLVDFMDVLKLGANRIARGEKSGQVRGLDGKTVGSFSVEEE